MKRARRKPGTRVASRSAVSRPGASRSRVARRASPSGGLLRLPDALEIHCVRDFARLARERLASGGAMRIDGSAVQSADTAGLQLLLALRRDVLASGTSFEWHGISPVLLETGALLGLSAALGLVEAP